MKRAIGTFVSLVLALSVFAQGKIPESKPQGMEFIPAGSFQMTNKWDSESKVTSVTVEAFWMSNEVTNAEYREFVDWAKSNPEKVLYQVKYSKAVVSDLKKGITKDTIIRKITPIKVSSLIPDIIDPLCMEKADQQYKDYFTNQKFNDYPVTGVSFMMAEYYCIWKTTTENEGLEKQGLPDVHSYRIPLETEWEYVAQQNIKEVGDKSTIDKLSKVNEGTVNEFGLSHFNDNVSEWATPNRGGTVIIRGGSWKSGNSISERIITDPDTREPYIGFRIVRSYTQPRDNKK
jgi:formylglycine-generating enzyme required for sulfatase activity